MEVVVFIFNWGHGNVWSIQVKSIFKSEFNLFRSTTVCTPNSIHCKLLAHIQHKEAMFFVPFVYFNLIFVDCVLSIELLWSWLYSECSVNIVHRSFQTTRTVLDIRVWMINFLFEFALCTHKLYASTPVVMQQLAL